ncbi:DNA/RNA helicase domain-containing protein [Streptococcus parauberis]|uniref:DNA/RNA helicase domain-containing protein n=1 Tax=Streptococcus parauberis TaxID=1348 RepID=UPI00374CD4CB
MIFQDILISFFGYIIPQINKEFDLVRFGKNYNINIELKSETTTDDQKKQLITNHFYLNFLPVKTYYFSISPNISSYLEYLPDENKFINLKPEKLLQLIKEQEIMNCSPKEANEFFKIKNFLVSPFNDIEKFVNNKYFLTNHQQEIVNEIVENPSNLRSFGIRGNPGTGKSLLVYHIAKTLMQLNKKVAIIHGANLNLGQAELNNMGYNIVPVKKFSQILDNAEKYDFIIIDEAQRLRENHKYQQLTELSKAILESKSQFIVSLDGRQTLSPEETIDNITLLLDFINKNGKVFGLKDKFRTNQEMSEFIKLLFKFPMDREIEKLSNDKRNIRVKYFSEKISGDEYLRQMSLDSNWKVLNYTKSSPGRFFAREKEPLDEMCEYGEFSHSVIGQEFDQVIIPLDSNFFYEKIIYTNEKDGEKREFMLLKTSNSYYPLDKMLYQNITRTREILEIVIIGNYSLFLNISRLLNKI